MCPVAMQWILACFLPMQFLMKCQRVLITSTDRDPTIQKPIASISNNQTSSIPVQLVSVYSIVAIVIYFFLDSKMPLMAIKSFSMLGMLVQLSLNHQCFGRWCQREAREFYFNDFKNNLLSFYSQTWKVTSFFQIRYWNRYFGKSIVHLIIYIDKYVKMNALWIHIRLYAYFLHE